MKKVIFLILCTFCFSLSAEKLANESGSFAASSKQFGFFPINMDFISGVLTKEVLLKNINNNAVYKLRGAPKGMYLNTSRILFWNPPKSFEGETFNIYVEEIINEKIVNARSFTISVAKTVPIDIKINKNTIDIDRKFCGTPLHDQINFSLSFPDLNSNEIKNIRIEKITNSDKYVIPFGVIRNSCFFIIEDIKPDRLLTKIEQTKRKDSYSRPQIATSSKPWKYPNLYKYDGSSPFVMDTPVKVNSFSRNKWHSHDQSRSINGIYFIGSYDNSLSVNSMIIWLSYYLKPIIFLLIILLGLFIYYRTIKKHK